MLTLSTNMQEYFKEGLSSVIRNFSHDFSDELQSYLVCLLCEFARTERVYAGINFGEEPILVLLWERALESPLPEANRIFKQIGDSILYLSGYFGEKTQASGVSNNYYVALGGQAYSQLAQNTQVAIYEELSKTFE